MGSDHGGFELKSHLKRFLQDQGHEIEDLGCQNNSSIDYPKFGRSVAERVVRNRNLGIVLCGTGIGISIAANKIIGARCALCTSEEMATLARKHNDAQILALGGRMISQELAEKIVTAFISTDFSGDPRHSRRIAQLEG